MELPLCGFAFGVVGFFLVGSIQTNLGLCLCLSWFFLSDKLLHVLDYNHFLCRVVK